MKICGNKFVDGKECNFQAAYFCDNSFFLKICDLKTIFDHFRPKDYIMLKFAQMLVSNCPTSSN